MKNRKTLVSGIQASGKVHIGNYFGAMKQFVELQEDYNSYIFIADLHALTTLSDPEALNSHILDLAIDYLAIGLDPQKTTLYKQSDVQQVTELAWIFECITTFSYLSRAHAFKDSVSKNREINVGVFNYPMLMAADILLPSADVVPVGLDQKQHLEITRDTAIKFNRLFGEEFKIPKPLILKEVETVPGIDGRKMSKSYKNTIELFAEENEIKDSVMKIPTDSKEINDPKDPDKCKIFALHKLFAQEDELKELRELYKKGKIGYQESKEILIKKINDFIKPLRERRKVFSSNKKDILGILKSGGQEVRAQAEEKMKGVRSRIGINIYQ